MKFALLMPAAGSGVRLGSDIPKALLEMTGDPMFIHAVRPFLRFTECVEIVIAAPRDWEVRFQSAVDREGMEDRVCVVTGGTTRQDSVQLALSAMISDADHVLIHDAARPLVSADVIDRVLEALTTFDAAVPALRIADTLKHTDASMKILGTVDRTGLVAAQTPQGIRRIVFEQAQRQAQAMDYCGTDDVSLVEHFGLGWIKVVAGDPLNFKITTGDDLTLAKKLLELNA